MIFYITKENSTGCSFKTADEFIKDLTYRITEAEENGQKYFSIIIEDSEDSENE